MTQDAHNAINSSDNPFWRYSLAIYSQPGAADFLLDAQQQYQLDINILLFIGWLAQNNKRFIPHPRLHTHIFPFNKHTIMRIRDLRIRIKTFNNQKFYDAIKSCELYAEYCEQCRLNTLSKLMPNTADQQSKVIKQGVIEYFKQIEGKADTDLKVNWLQTLIKHLQPV